MKIEIKESISLFKGYQFANSSFILSIKYILNAEIIHEVLVHLNGNPCRPVEAGKANGNNWNDPKCYGIQNLLTNSQLILS